MDGSLFCWGRCSGRGTGIGAEGSGCCDVDGTRSLGPAVRITVPTTENTSVFIGATDIKLASCALGGVMFMLTFVPVTEGAIQGRRRSILRV
jgi:hypothetical protein